MSELTPKEPKTPEEKRARAHKIRTMVLDMFLPVLAALFLILAVIWPNSIMASLAGIFAGAMLIRFSVTRYQGERGDAGLRQAGHGRRDRANPAGGGAAGADGADCGGRAGTGRTAVPAAIREKKAGGFRLLLCAARRWRIYGKSWRGRRKDWLEQWAFLTEGWPLYPNTARCAPTSGTAAARFADGAGTYS